MIDRVNGKVTVITQEGILRFWARNIVRGMQKATVVGCASSYDPGQNF